MESLELLHQLLSSLTIEDKRLIAMYMVTSALINAIVFYGFEVALKFIHIIVSLIYEFVPFRARTVVSTDVTDPKEKTNY